MSDMVNHLPRDGSQPKSVAELRKEGRPVSVDYPQTDENGPVSAEENTWVPEALEYYKERLDAIDLMLKVLHRDIGKVAETQHRIDELLERIEDALGERSEPDSGPVD